jgi:hypothetical protein
MYLCHASSYNHESEDGNARAGSAQQAPPSSGGSITVTASAKGLQSASTTITVAAA